MGNFRHGRPTIGVLAGEQIYEGTLQSFLAPLLRGITEAAVERDCNLLLACGVGHAMDPARICPAWPVADDDTDFVPVGPWNADGLIAIAPLVTSARSNYVQGLRADGYPVVFVGAGEDGPCVVPDDSAGVRQAIAHLVTHGHRAIAFVAGGPSALDDYGARLQAYHAGLQEHGLAVNSDLVRRDAGNASASASAGSGAAGFDATQRLLASGAEFTAILAATDRAAYGAMRALREAGRRVPQHVAVIGFDDRFESSMMAPPLTSVHFPVFEAGFQALLLLLRQLSPTGGDGQPAEAIRIPTRLVVRESCGCRPSSPATVSTAETQLRATGPRAPDPKSELTHLIREAVPVGPRHMSADEVNILYRRLVEAFAASLAQSDPSLFRAAFVDILQRVEMAGDDAHAWQAAVSALQRGIPSLLGGASRSVLPQQAEEMLHQARISISESERRRHARYLMHQASVADQVGRMADRLLTARDETHVFEVVADEFAGIGVRPAPVVLFEPEADDPVAWSVLHGRPGTVPRRFPSREFPPPGLGLTDAGEPFRLALLPLAGQADVQGFMAFDAENLEPCAALVRQVAAALKSSRLQARLHDLALVDSLTGLHNRRSFDLALENELERNRRYGRSLALLRIEVNGFRDYRRSAGPAVTDHMLRQLAPAMTNSARRAVDVSARLEAGSFAVMLPETDGPGASVVAERIRAAFAKAALHRPAGLSIGVAVTHGESADPNALMARAELALKQAEATAGNQVVVMEARVSDPSDAHGSA